MDEIVRMPKHGFYGRAQSGLQLRDQRVRRTLRELRQVAPWLDEARTQLPRRIIDRMKHFE
jgi:hypothetical protein